MVYEMEWANKLVHFMRFSLFKKSISMPYEGKL